MLKINEKAPDFTLPDYRGEMHSLHDFLGQKVVLYFYPKDNTSGCTSQALAFKELKDQFASLNVQIIGISKDSPSSHQKFIEKYGLNFLLLSDEEAKVIQAYDVWKEKSMYGRKYMGIVRSTFIIDEQGNLISQEYKVSPKENPICTLNLVKGE